MAGWKIAIRRCLVGCCARAVSGHAAAPASPAMNSRRLMGLPPNRAEVACHKGCHLSRPTSDRRVAEGGAHFFCTSLLLQIRDDPKELGRRWKNSSEDDVRVLPHIWWLGAVPSTRAARLPGGRDALNTQIDTIAMTRPLVILAVSPSATQDGGDGRYNSQAAKHERRYVSG